MNITVLIAKLVLAYLLGSLSGSLLLGRWRGVDVRALGSGNAGGTNALRTQGLRFALGVVTIDVGKALLAVWLAQWGIADFELATRIGLAAGAAAAMGHVWPIFFGFRGGKGAATLVGALLMLWPLLLLPLVAVWLLVLMVTGYVGLATILAGIAMIPCVWVLAPAQSTEWLIAAVVVALFLLWTHRANLRRLMAGNEPCFERVRVLGRWMNLQ